MALEIEIFAIIMTGIQTIHVFFRAILLITQAIRSFPLTYSECRVYVHEKHVRRCYYFITYESYS